MKLQTQFTVPKKELKHLNYVKKVYFSEETLNKECEQHPSNNHCKIFCD